MRQTFFGKAARLVSLRSIAALVLAAASATALPAAAANSKYAAIVIDASTGKTLHSTSADAPRYPASLTKMMTLYLTFEAMKAGRLGKNTPVKFSANASGKPPTKLGVRAGGSISVETAILSLVTKSANDAATALGEMMAGSEPAFARMMTAKARQLGMNSTTFRNASGLPDTQQKTTARDMAILGIALREHFPQYYGYFSTRSFTHGRQRMGNHNKLLGRIKGVDGIKTGFTRASGFNLVSSVAVGDRRIVAVVMGGTSGRSRDDQMARLIKQYLPQASTAKRGPLVASARTSSIQALAKALLPKRSPALPEAKPEPAPVVAAAAEPSPRVDAPVAEAAVAADVAEGSVEEAAAPFAQAYAEPEKPVKSARLKRAAVDPLNTASTAPSGWAIQVASSPSETEARAFLSSTSAKAASILGSALAYTVPFDNSGTTYFRARFGGFSSKTAAWNACGALKKKKISCYAIQQ